MQLVDNQNHAVYMIPSRCPYSAIPLIRAESRATNPDYSIFSDSQLKASIDSMNGQIPLDPELARLAIITNTDRYHRVWAYAQRAFDGNGKIQINLLQGHLKSIGIVKTSRTFRDIIQKGEINGFWHVAGEYIYLKAYKKLSAKLTIKAHDIDPDTVATNRAGTRKVIIDVRGNLIAYRARLYGAWIDGKRISRYTLQKLWQQSKPTLISWERQAKIKVTANYAQDQLGEEIENPHAPEHSYLCANHDGNDFISWQLSNSYSFDGYTDYTKGQASKARKTSNHNLEEHRATLPDGALNSLLSYTGKLYFEDTNGRKFVPAYKHLDRHLRKHGDYERSHYSKLGYKRSRLNNRTIGIFERCDDYERTTLLQRDFAQEKTPEFQVMRDGYRAVIGN